MTDEDTPPELAIVGIGNELCSDDGVGPRVVATIESTPGMPPRGTRLYNAGTTGFFALEAMSGCDRAIVVDAIETGAEPGTIHQYRFTDGAFDGEIPEVTMHDVSFTEALGFASDVYDLPDDVLIIGVEPESLGTGFGLTDPVERAIPGVVETIAAHEPAIDPDRLEGTAGPATEREVIDA